MFEFDKIEPSYHLKDIIKSFWFIERTDVPSPPLYLIPDGFPEIVFYSSKPLSFVDEDGQSDTNKAPIFCGQLSKTKELYAPVGTHAVFVKLFPWAALRLFSIQEYNYVDKCVPLNFLLRESEVISIANQIENSSSKELIRTIIENFLTKKLAEMNGQGNLFKHFITNMLASPGNMNFDHIFNGVRCSRRYIEKIFTSTIGLSPGRYMSALRVKEISRKLGVGSFQKLSQVAIEHDYFDQSHFNKDFLKKTGFTPSQYINYMKDFPIVQKSKYLDQFDHSNPLFS